MVDDLRYKEHLSDDREKLLKEIIIRRLPDDYRTFLQAHTSKIIHEILLSTWGAAFSSLPENFTVAYDEAVRSAYIKYLKKSNTNLLASVGNWTLRYIEKSEIDILSLKQSRKTIISDTLPVVQTSVNSDENEIKIRGHMMSESVSQGNIDGVQFEDKSGAIIGCIYFDDITQKEYILIDRHIAENPKNASFLIQEMKKAYKKIAKRHK